MPPVEPRYDSTLLLACARRLYSKAALSAPLSTLFGALLGALASSITQRGHLSSGEVVLIVAGATVLGYFVGSARALSLRMKAQALLCQMTIERNTAEVERNTRIWARLAGRVGPADEPRS